MLGMLVGEEDAAHQVVALPYHPDLLRGLDEIERLERKQQLARHAARIAARLGGEGMSRLAPEHLLVRGQHLRRRPRLENRVLGVADALGRLRAGALRLDIAVKGMGGVVPIGPWP